MPTQRVRFPRARKPTSTSGPTRGQLREPGPAVARRAARPEPPPRRLPSRCGRDRDRRSDDGPESSELLRPPLVRRAPPSVRGIHRQPLVPEELRGRRAALAEPNYGASRESHATARTARPASSAHLQGGECHQRAEQPQDVEPGTTAPHQRASRKAAEPRHAETPVGVGVLAAPRALVPLGNTEVCRITLTASAAKTPPSAAARTPP